MKLAFCLFNYFPFGGLQRDFFHIAEVCRNRGHEIHVFTMKWEGEMPRDFAHFPDISRGINKPYPLPEFFEKGL